jgi:hypothetical protein
LHKKLNEIGVAVDIFKSHHNFHPFTFGYNGDNLKHYDRVLTAKEDMGSFQTLDYMFEITLRKDSKVKISKAPIRSTDILKTGKSDFISSSMSNSISEKIILNIKDDNGIIIKTDEKENNGNKPSKTLTVDHSSSAVEHFLINDKPYQQLSDHFGLSVNIKYA